MFLLASGFLDVECQTNARGLRPRTCRPGSLIEGIGGRTLGGSHFSQSRTSEVPSPTLRSVMPFSSERENINTAPELTESIPRGYKDVEVVTSLFFLIVLPSLLLLIAHLSPAAVRPRGPAAGVYDQYYD